jgi:hypothetical protein
MARGGGPNQKAVAAAEKKAANTTVKDAAKARAAEATLAAEWAQGSNARGQSKAESAAAKADEIARKKREKAELLAAEEQANGSGGKAIKSSKLSAASKNKKKNDLALLEDALVGDAEKKLKEKKRLERLKKEREAAAAMEHERKAKEELAKRDPLLANTDAMIGNMIDEEGMEGGDAVGRAANVASMADIQASGVDAAISAMSLGGGGEEDKHPEKRMKAAYKAYEEKMMPEMKQQYPGLKRQQYLDKIFSSWKKSPENPLNQQ